MKLLIIGGSGFLGGELLRRAPAAGFAAAATYSTRPPEAAGTSPGTGSTSGIPRG